MALRMMATLRQVNTSQQQTCRKSHMEPTVGIAEMYDAAGEQGVQPGGGRRGTDASITAENATLRHELAQLRSQHVTTRIRCVLL
jgi:hypothetical protein